jgi:integrase
MKNNSFNTIHRNLNAILNFNSDEYVSQIVSVEKLPEKDSGRRHQIISDDEIICIRENLSDPELVDAIDVDWLTGLRIGTLLRLGKSCFQIKKREIMIPASINKGKVYGYNIPIFRELDPILARRLKSSDLANEVFEFYAKTHRNIAKFSEEMKKEYLNQAKNCFFPGVVLFGADGYIKYAEEEFRSACDAAQISDRRIHDIRRTFAVRLLNSGLDYLVIKKLLGHRSILTTERYIEKQSVEIKELFKPIGNEFSKDELYKLQYEC